MPTEWLKYAINATNIAQSLSDEKLTEIASNVEAGYKEDDVSRQEWENKQDEYMRLALQVVETKNTPWPNAANVKYPLLTTATMQFGARAYPSLISSPSIVKGRVTGFDETGEKAKSAERVGKHMSYQLIEEMDEWEEDMDKLSVSLPIVGCMFKKTYFSPSKDRNVSELIYPKKLVVNYWTKTLLTAPRITHVLHLSDNDVYERIASGVFIDQDYEKKHAEPDRVQDEIHGIQEPSRGETTPHEFLEQHTWIDLDDDGYKEPYIVTWGGNSIARIVAGFGEEDIVYANDNRVIKINRIEYFTKYGFVPNPDGSFYDIGFGLLLGPINETINTTINQLLDAGTLATRQCGFLGRGIRFKGGIKNFAPGEWKQTQTSGSDLKSNIIPLPVKEPSMVLFSLLGMMIEFGKELSSTVPMIMGQNPGQNQPATTSMAVIEQGLKVFSAIFKRMHRSLKQELKKLKKLNQLYLPPEVYFKVLDAKEGQDGGMQIFQQDYNDDVTDVQPYSDPNIVSDTQRMIKSQQISEMLSQNLIPNPQEGARIILEALDLPEVDKLLTPPEPSPDPEMELKQDEFEHKVKMDQARIKLDGARLALDEDISDDIEKKYESEMLLNIAKAEAAEEGTQLGIYKAELERLKLRMEAKEKDNGLLSNDR